MHDDVTQIQITFENNIPLHDVFPIVHCIQTHLLYGNITSMQSQVLTLIRHFLLVKAAFVTRESSF